MKISALFSMWIWNRCVVPSIMSNVSDKNCVFNKMAIHQKRKASFRGMKTKSICFIMTLFYTALNVFSGSINYLCEGALIQPTLSFSTAASHSSGKIWLFIFIWYINSRMIDYIVGIFKLFELILTYAMKTYLFKADFIFFCIFIRSWTKNVGKLENNSKAFLSQFVSFIITHKG